MYARMVSGTFGTPWITNRPSLLVGRWVAALNRPARAKVAKTLAPATGLPFGLTTVPATDLSSFVKEYGSTSRVWPAATRTEPDRFVVVRSAYPLAKGRRTNFLSASTKGNSNRPLSSVVAESLEVTARAVPAVSLIKKVDEYADDRLIPFQYAL